MSSVHQSAVVASLRVGAWLTSPLLVLSGLACCNSVNPMQMEFVTEMAIVNQSREDLIVSPIGELHGSGRLSALPLFLCKEPAIRAPRNGGFPLASGTTLRLFYDCDDIDATEIVVETAAGTLKAVPIGSRPGPYVIEQLDELPKATASAQAAAGGSALGSFLLYYFGWMVPLVLFVASRVARADR